MEHIHHADNMIAFVICNDILIDIKMVNLSLSQFDEMSAIRNIVNCVIKSTLNHLESIDSHEV